MIQVNKCLELQADHICKYSITQVLKWSPGLRCTWAKYSSALSKFAHFEKSSALIS